MPDHPLINDAPRVTLAANRSRAQHVRGAGRDTSNFLRYALSHTHRAFNLENVFLIGTRAFEFKLRKDHLEHTAELQWESSSAEAHGWRHSN